MLQYCCTHNGVIDKLKYLFDNTMYNLFRLVMLFIFLKHFQIEDLVLPKYQKENKF